MNNPPESVGQLVSWFMERASIPYSKETYQWHLERAMGICKQWGVDAVVRAVVAYDELYGDDLKSLATLSHKHVDGVPLLVYASTPPPTPPAYDVSAMSYYYQRWKNILSPETATTILSILPEATELRHGY